MSFTFVFLSSFIIPLHAQTSISGTINTYVSVTALNLPSNAMTVSSVAGLALGDLVLIIQMQGASITSTPATSSAFGNVTSYGGAGSYELVNICSINGNELTFEQELVNNDYESSGKIQLIKVPQYSHAEVTSTLTGQAWNGSTGGIVALIASEKLTLSADINMDEKGFRGGVYENDNTTNCNGTESNYYYATAVDGGEKGEGIAAFISGKEYGKGAQANGGGGGNDHNSGGGGGGNTAAGGLGGENDDPGFFRCKGRHPGIGGKALSPTNRLFLGGGGGAGHGNNQGVIAGGTSGGNGGGIVLIITDTLEANGSVSITVNGESAANSVADGAGGGGAGGSIYLDVNTYIGNPTLATVGGDGGDANNDNQNRCFGPGGGGAGGQIKSSNSLPGAVPTSVLAGTAGATIFTSNGSCNVGATNGSNGIISVEALVRSTTNYPFCNLLPVTWGDVSIQALEKEALLTWEVENAYQHAYFTIERGTDGRTFEPLFKLSDALSSSHEGTFKWLDNDPIIGIKSYYRIRQTDLNGNFSFSSTLSLTLTSPFSLTIYPNPLLANRPLQVTYFLPTSGNISFRLVDGMGRAVYEKRIHAEIGKGNLTLPISLAKGIYFLLVNTPEEKVVKRLVVIGN